MSELIDLVNERGEIVRRGVTREDASENDGLYMRIVIVAIFNSMGQVLVHERAKRKTVNGGCIDLVCGAIASGETSMNAAIRESREETGVEPENLRVVREGINPYGRYCYLLVGESDQGPGMELDPNEVAWAAYMDVADLTKAFENQTLKFVDGFFDDLAIAQQTVHAPQET